MKILYIIIALVSFVIGVLFNCLIFTIVNRYIGEVGAFIGILLIKFICFWLPAFDFLKMNFGIAQILEKGKLEYDFYIKCLGIALLVLYWTSQGARRKKYVDNRV